MHETHHILTRRPIFICLAVATMAVGAAGCTSPVGVSADVAEQAPAEDPAGVDGSDAPEELRVGHALLRILAESLQEVNLRPEQQQAIQTIRADMEAATRPVREARQALTTTAADGVAAGSIDDAKIDAGVRKLVGAVTASKPALQDALNRLHATLDPAQRQLLVERMRDRGAALRERVADQGGPLAMVRARLRRLADDLALTSGQRVAIRDKAREGMRGAMAEWGPERRREAMARVKEIGDTFMTDEFDARTLDVAREAPVATQKISTGLVRFAKTVLPELTTEQRAKLAVIIRQRAAAAAAPPAP